MKVRLTTLGAAACLAVLLGYGLAMHATGVLDNADAMSRTTMIPSDTVRYAAAGEAGDLQLLSAVDVVLGALNFSTLSVTFGFFQNNYSAGAWAFLVLNATLVAFTLSGSIALLAESGYIVKSKELSLLLPALVLCCMPYTWGWVLGPNKELVVGAAVIGVMRALNRSNILLALALAMLAATVKVQFLYAMILYLCTVRLPYRKTVCLVGISLVLPVVLNYYSGLTFEQFMENIEGDDTIRTAPLFAFLDQIAAYPFGFVLVAPARFLLNCLAGLYPQRVIGASTIGGIIAPATSMILGVLCTAFPLLRWRTFLAALTRRSSPAWHFCYTFVVVSCLVPYLQPRYFWWLVPLIFIALIAWASSGFGADRRSSGSTAKRLDGRE